MDKRLCALGAAGRAVVENINHDPKSAIDVGQAHGLIVSSIQQQFGTNYPIIAGRHNEMNGDRPPTYWFICHTDGSAALSWQKFSMCVGFILAGRPMYAMVIAPGLHPHPFVAHRDFGCCCCNGAARPVLWHLHDDRPLQREQNPPTCQPHLTAGVRIIAKTTAYEFFDHAKIWELAAGALLVRECGGVTACLDGAPIPWNQVDLPPLIFAASDGMASKANRAVIPLIAP